MIKQYALWLLATGPALIFLGLILALLVPTASLALLWSFCAIIGSGVASLAVGLFNLIMSCCTQREPPQVESFPATIGSAITQLHISSMIQYQISAPTKDIDADDTKAIKLTI
jgi:hypothetical protein